MEHSRASIDALQSDHEEADSRMFPMFHMLWNYIDHEELLYGT